MHQSTAEDVHALGCDDLGGKKKECSHEALNLPFPPPPLFFFFFFSLFFKKGGFFFLFLFHFLSLYYYSSIKAVR